MSRPLHRRPPGPARPLFLKRKALGLTIDAAAKRIGISQNHLSQIEMGKRRASPGLLALIAETLDSVERAA